MVINKDKLTLGEMHNKVIQQLPEYGFDDPKSKLHPFFQCCVGEISWSDMINKIAKKFNKR